MLRAQQEICCSLMHAGGNDALVCRDGGRLADAETSSDDSGEVGLEKCCLVRRHGCLHSHTLHQSAVVT